MHLENYPIHNSPTGFTDEPEMMMYRREVDGLRALAVVPVILFHANFHAFLGGYVGVDVFFVISGYLITSLLVADLERGSFSLSHFYERRARRILPALFTVMVCCLLPAWLWLAPDELVDFARSVIAVVTFVSNFFFYYHSNYFDTLSEMRPLLHTWSLAVEEQYYLLFPLILAACWPLGLRRIMGLAVLFAVASLILANHCVGIHPSFTFFLLPTRAWELLIGATVAMVRLPRTADSTVSPLQESAGFVGLALIGFAVK